MQSSPSIVRNLDKELVWKSQEGATICTHLGRNEGAKYVMSMRATRSTMTWRKTVSDTYIVSDTADLVCLGCMVFR